MPVSLHTHSWYSLLEGVSSPEALVARAVEGGHTSLALTDTNNLYGVVPFVELAKQARLRPIVGACLRHGGRQAVALVAEREGYHNLCQVISGVQLSGVERFCEASLTDLLGAYHGGLHVLTADPELAEQLHGAFRDRLWLEVIRPGCPPKERKLLDCAKRLGVRLVASTAAHLTHADEYPTLRLAAAVRENTLLDRLPPTGPVTPEHRLLSVTEMRRRFRDLPEALAAGDDLAGLLRADVLPRELILPGPKLTRPLDLVAYFKAHCEPRLRRRGLEGDPTARQRLREEQAVIGAKGLAGYFLTVHDIARQRGTAATRWARRQPPATRWCATCSASPRADPPRFGLEMERFLHMERIDLPDIDLDFDWKVRDEIIDYVIRKHGGEHVARISAHLSLQPRSAFRESAKVHGLSDGQVSELLTHLDERVEETLLPDPARPAPRVPASPRSPGACAAGRASSPTPAGCWAGPRTCRCTPAASSSRRARCAPMPRCSGPPRASS
ncbi:MAG: PHP domain-containing protein [Gemmataceae bacterium]